MVKKQQKISPEGIKNGSKKVVKRTPGFEPGT